MKWRALLAGWCLLVPGVAAGEVLLQEVVQAGRFVFHRDSGDRHGYYYVPDEPRLAVGRDGRPQFTFIKYTRAGSEAAGRGGLVHFLVTWGFTDTQLREAERALRGVDREGRIVGPVPFREGRFAVVSASAGGDGLFTRKVVGEGKAPLLPGQKAAVSVALTPEGATVLWEAFQRPTSEVSVVFLLTYSGLTPAYAATLSVDWDSVYRHRDISAGVSGQYGVLRGEADVRAIYDDLRRTGAVRLDVTGTSAPSEALLQIAYEHLVRQLFEPTLGEPSASPLARTRWWDHALGWLSSRYFAPSHSAAKKFRPLPSLDRRQSTTDRVTPNALLERPAEPWTPFPQDPNGHTFWGESSVRLFHDARSKYVAGDYTGALQRFLALYERGYQGLQTGAGRVDQEQWLSQVAWNVAQCHSRLGNTRRQLYYLIVSAGLDPEPTAELRTALRTAFEEPERDASPMPRGLSALARFAMAREDRMFLSSLTNLRNVYFHGHYARVVQMGTDEWRRPSMSERSLWVARAHDHLSQPRDAVRWYRQYLQELADEGGEADNVVQARLRQLETSPAAAPELPSPSTTGASRPPTSGAGSEPSQPRPPQPPPASESAAGLSPPRPPQPPTASERAAGSSQPRPPQPPTPSERAADLSPPRPSPASGTASSSPPSFSGNPVSAGGSSSSTSPPALIGLRVSYVYRRVKQQGQYQVDLRHRLREDREMSMAGNIGGFVRGDTARFLTEVNLDDPFFRDRSIDIVLDGQDHADLQSYVNAVSVQLRRRHDDGGTTDGDVRFFAEQFASAGNRQVWTYPRLGDGAGWLKFEFRPVWDFFGGGRWEGPWTSTETSVVQLASPVRYRAVRVGLDEAEVIRNEIAAVTVQFRHSLFGRTITRELVFDYTGGDPLIGRYRFPAATDAATYEIRVVWTTRRGGEVVQDWTPRETGYLQLAFPGGPR